MPQKTRTPIRPRVSPQVQDQPQQSLQVLARPVDQYEAPATSSGLQALVAGLSAVQPGLTKYLESRVMDEQVEADKRNKEQTLRGKQARSDQGHDGVVLTPEQDPFFQQGYMQKHGEVMGFRRAREMELRYETERTNPDFNIDRFLSEFESTDVEGINDQDALAGYLGITDRAKESLRNKAMERQIDDLRETNDTNLREYSRFLVTTDPRRDSVNRFNDWLQFREDAKQLGKTNNEAARMWVDALIESSKDGNPEVFEHVDLKDASGISLMDTKEQLRIIQARQQAIAAEAAKLNKDHALENAKIRYGLQQQLEADPFDPTLSADAILTDAYVGQGKVFSTDNEAVSFLMDVRKRQAEAYKAAQYAKVVDNGGGRFYAHDPEFAKVFNRKLDDVWANIDFSTRETTRVGINRIIELTEQNGLPYERLKGLLSSVATSVPNANGFNPDFELASHIYWSMANSNNPQLVKMYVDEDSEQVLREYWYQADTKGLPREKAFLEAKRLTTPEARERARAMLTPQFSKVLDKAVDDSFDRWFKDVENGSMLKYEARELAKRYMAKGQLDPERAAEYAIADVKGQLIWDGVSRYVKVPRKLLGTKDLEPSVKDFLQSHTKALGPRAIEGNYYLEAGRNGDSFHVFDPLGNATGVQITTDQLLARYRNKVYATPQDIQRIQEIRKLLSQPQLIRDHAEEIALENEITALRGKGVATVEDANLAASVGIKRTADWLTGKTSSLRAAKSNRVAVGEVFDGRSPSYVNLPVPNPGMGNLPSMDYAKRLIDTDPALALTVAAEGMRVRTYGDNKGVAIGIGYNITMRQKTFRKDFIKAGIAPEHVDEVAQGKRSITPEQMVKLYQVVKPEYESMAAKAYGPGWDALPPHQKAALTDLAYNTGKPEQYTKALAALREGDIDKAASQIHIWFTSKRGDAKQYSTRRVQLIRAMLKSPQHFKTLISK